MSKDKQKDYVVNGSDSAKLVSCTFNEFIISLGAILDNDNDLTDIESIIIKRLFSSLSNFENDLHIAMFDISKMKELLRIED